MKPQSEIRWIFISFTLELFHHWFDELRLHEIFSLWFKIGISRDWKFKNSLWVENLPPLVEIISISTRSIIKIILIWNSTLSISMANCLMGKSNGLKKGRKLKIENWLQNENSFRARLQKGKYLFSHWTLKSF